MCPTLLVVAILFLLSLSAAVILFKYLKSSATVTDERYQAGGAIAGFIIISGILYPAYYTIEMRDYKTLITTHEKLQNDYKELINEHQKLSQMSVISGNISPYQQYTKVVLAVKETDLDPTGDFQLRVRCIDPKEDDIRVHVIMPDKPVFYNIHTQEQMTNIKIHLSDKN
jgi:hypothetical protein